MGCKKIEYLHHFFVKVVSTSVSSSPRMPKHSVFHTKVRMAYSVNSSIGRTGFSPFLRWNHINVRWNRSAWRLLRIGIKSLVFYFFGVVARIVVRRFYGVLLISKSIMQSDCAGHVVMFTMVL